MDLSPNTDKIVTEKEMRKDINDIPLSESNVSLKLADIQRRCSDLMLAPGDELELSLEEPASKPEENNPYNLG